MGGGTTTTTTTKMSSTTPAEGRYENGILMATGTGKLINTYNTNGFKGRGDIDSRVDTAQRTIIRNGDVFAVPHAHEKTGYKAVPAATPKDHFSTTTNGAFAPPIHHSTTDKPLVPYAALSSRNRLPVKFDREPKKYVRHCAPNNVSTIQLGDPAAPDESRFRTTYQTHFQSKQLPVGFSNTGILSQKTAWAHKRELD